MTAAGSRPWDLFPYSCLSSRSRGSDGSRISTKDPFHCGSRTVAGRSKQLFPLSIFEAFKYSICRYRLILLPPCYRIEREGQGTMRKRRLRDQGKSGFFSPSFHVIQCRRELRICRLGVRVPPGAPQFFPFTSFATILLPLHQDQYVLPFAHDLKGDDNQRRVSHRGGVPR